MGCIVSMREILGKAGNYLFPVKAFCNYYVVDSVKVSINCVEAFGEI